jgi:hypothetical protein
METRKPGHNPETREQEQMPSEIAKRLVEAYPQLPREEGAERTETVGTGRLRVVDAGEPIQSNGFYGCTALLIMGPNKTMLAHMTVSEKLPVHGYIPVNGTEFEREYVDQRQHDMLQKAKEEGVDFENSSYIIIAEPGNAHRRQVDTPEKFSIEDTKTGLDKLVENLAKQGLTTGSVVESPVSIFSVRHEPADGGTYLTGLPNTYNERGRLDKVRPEQPETLFLGSDGALPSGKEVQYPIK